MKLLVIGIDGGTKQIIDQMPMPYTQSLFDQAVSRELNEDLISRGWAEILTGQHASTNKAFYLMPCADRTYDFSATYTKSDMVSASPTPPLWEQLNKSGASVGIMNIPTTGPADAVDGFLVAGGGGGLQPGAAVPPGMIHPENYSSVLRDNGYVFDIRLPGGTRTVSEFLQKISQAENVQTTTFLDLTDKEKPDFGFHCFRITTEVQYLARYEIDLCIEGLQAAKQRGEEFVPESTIQQAVIDHYKTLDNNIRRLFEKLEPENFIFVGDHSTALFLNEGNLDVFLEEAGYLTKLSGVGHFIQRLLRFVKRKIQARSGSQKQGLIRRPITPFSRSKTRAFGTFYDTGNFAGIFINDNERFGGPVKTQAEAAALVGEICERFNAHPTAKAHAMIARPYRQEYAGYQFQKLMPDIKIHKPDSIYFSSRRWAFVAPNPNVKPLEESLQGIRYPHTGAKGSDPLCVYNKELKNYFENATDPEDLRLVYTAICRYVESNCTQQKTVSE